MSDKLIPLVLLFSGAVIDTLGDVIMKSWVESNRRIVFVIGLVVYMAGITLLAKSYRYENIAVASVIFVIFNVVILAIVSWLHFKEPLTPVQIGGILMGIAAVALLEFGKVKA